MDLIPSFSVDHTQIIPGIFESRVDIVGEEYVTTFDIRIKKPNSEPAIAPAAMHTIKNPTIGLGCCILHIAAIKSQTVNPQIIRIEARAPKTSNL